MIALLLCLRKVLEKVITKRLTTFTFKAKFFSDLYFRAILGRFAIDDIATFVHNVEKAI